jgi:ABC-type polysaccharide/polyol phosphate transport system ATPase subunit
MDLTAYREKVKDWFDQVKLPVRKPDAAPELEVKGLSYSYIPGIPVLEDINFTIHKGEMISIVGKNGAGKSTLSSLICGFMRPDQGDPSCRSGYCRLVGKGTGRENRTCHAESGTDDFQADDLR